MATFMQSILIWLVFQEVVLSNVEWQNGIMKVGGGGGPGLLKSLSIEFFVLTNFEKTSKTFEKCLKYPKMVH